MRESRSFEKQKRIGLENNNYNTQMNKKKLIIKFKKIKKRINQDNGLFLIISLSVKIVLCVRVIVTAVPVRGEILTNLTNKKKFC